MKAIIATAALAVLLTGCAGSALTKEDDISTCAQELQKVTEKMQMNPEKYKFVRIGSSCSIVFKSEAEQREERMTTGEKVVRFVGQAIANNQHHYGYGTVRLSNGDYYSYRRAGSNLTFKKID